MHDHKLARMLRFGIRLSAIVTILLFGVSKRKDLGAFICEDVFLTCIEEEYCTESAVCTHGQCTGEVDCIGGPGCPEGQVAIICVMSPELGSPRSPCFW